MTTYTPTEQEVQVGKGYGILAYLGILMLIPLFTARDNRFVRYHCNQGLILLIIEIIARVLYFIPVINMLGAILDVVVLVLLILGIVNVAKGVCKPLPVIGSITLLQF